jgi:hypothetical protein
LADLSPSSGQLHATLPGLKEVGAETAGGARSMPSVDSVTVFRLPMTIMRQGVSQGRVDDGFTGRPFIVSRGSAKPTVYSPSGDS